MSAAPVSLETRAAEAAARLPALLTEAERVAGALGAGAHGRRRAGAGETFWQYRDYDSADAASLIDWRQSARAPGRLFVRQTEWETAASVHLWAGGGDSLDYGSDGETKRWRAQVAAVALALLLTRAGERAGPMDGPARGGRLGATALAEHLLAGPEGGALPPLPPAGATRLVYVSDFHVPLPTLEPRLAAIAASGRPAHLLQVSDPAEVSFPFSGRTVFASPSGTARHETGEAATLAADYAEARAAHLDTLARLCGRYGWSFTAHVTDAPLTPALAALHAAMSQDRAR